MIAYALGKKYANCFGVIILTLCTFNIHAQSAKANYLEINFTHYVENKLLQLDSVLYKNSLNQEFSVTKFKYYIGNISLLKKDGTAYLTKNYFLIDEEKPNSKKVLLNNIPNGEYVAINFTIGVDSIDNCSGAQSGVLDPINGMFWTWNTGYIFMKLEGISDSSNSPNALFEYHIGGYKKPHNYIKPISLLLAEPIVIAANSKSRVNIKTDVLEILKTPNPINFSKLSSVTDFNNASIIADNYMDMFSIFNTQDEK